MNEQKRKFIAELTAKPTRREEILEAQKQSDERNIVAYLIRGAKKRAKKNGLEFNVTKDDIELVHVCPILGVPLKRHRGKMERNSYSLDRVDSTKGYVKGNVRIVSWWANYLKERLTLEQARNLVRYMENS